MAEEIEDIIASHTAFDLGAALTEEEQGMLGRVYDGNERRYPDAPFRVREVEDVGEAVAAAETAPVSNQEHNEQYLHYARCQSLAALKAFTEGWDNFQKLVLNAYVNARQRENQKYRGDDRDKAFVLRLRQIAAEDFLDYINICMTEAEEAPKPSLEQK